MYDREYGDQELNFEASGALMQASLVMRDRETDSWWSIMSSTAIEGEMKGAELVELPVSEKATWGDWVARYPKTRVLSIDGREHEPIDHYRTYFDSEDTFRNLRISDRRLEPKEPVFSFWVDGRPYAVRQKDAEGGLLLNLEDGSGRKIYVFREPGSPMFASTTGYLVLQDEDSNLSAAVTLAEIDSRDYPHLEGFDTFWYSWVSINKETSLLP